ncbi:MAG: tetratricopeptide repeat protein [Gemmataceae bacterium]|nr:tetratricopeptide repeat protein [Gemmataceae bacterium]
MPRPAELFAVAVQHFQASRLAQAEQAFRQVVATQPQHAGALYFLGAIAYQQQLYAVAVQYWRQAVAAQPSDATFQSSLGAAYQALKLLAEAEGCHQRALALAPHHPMVLNNLGITLVSQRCTEEAIAVFQQAVALSPEDPELLHNLAAALRAQKRYDESIACYRQALQRRPSFAQAHHNLGIALQAQGFLAEAAASFQQALELHPHWASARFSLACALAEQGRVTEAQHCVLHALRLRPRDPVAHSGYLFTLNYDPQIEATQLFAEHRRWVQQQVRLMGHGTHDNTPDPERRLRIGYVSPDFRCHAAASFLEPILKHHDRQQVEIFCYSDVTTPDGETAYLHSLVEHWRETAAMADELMAELIGQDQIDLLIDLAGHTQDNRLLLFARKPAPVQINYLGYPCTTGLPTMDYRLVDAITDPPGEPRCHSEELVRLQPVFCCYAPPAQAPPVAPLPAPRWGAITFGALHKLEKFNDTVLDLWCRILQELPAARLLLARHVLRGETVAYWRQRFHERGLDSSRVVLRAVEPVNLQHLRLYDDIDIALDAFPWNGHTTACEALWMGVPVVTLRGQRHASRMVASVLSCLDLRELVAETPDEYCRIAVRLAGNLAQLGEWRASLRGRMLGSPLCDGRAFTRELEKAYRRLWQDWCQRRRTEETGAAALDLAREPRPIVEPGINRARKMRT